MNRRMRYPLLISLCILVLVLGYQNCARRARFSQEVPVLKNTVAGNPKVSNQIATGICEVIRRCHSQVDGNECLNGVMTAPGFASALGLQTDIDTLNAVLKGENSGTLIGNQVGANSCAQSIAALPCSSPLAQNAYQTTSSNPFAGSAAVVSGSACTESVNPASKYTCGTGAFVRGVENPAYAPPATIGTLTYSISPALPDGLRLDPATGVISGNPTIVSPLTSFTVTAASSDGSVSSIVEIKAADGYLVNDLGDAANAGDTSCATAGGTCTLRAAIQASNASTSNKVIVVPAGTIPLTSATRLSITRGVEIYGQCGQATVIDGMAATGVMQISAGPTTLERITIQNASTSNEMGSGLLITAGSGTFTTTLRKLSVRDNRNVGADSGMSNGAGIGVWGRDNSSQAIVNLSDCEISNNVNAGNFGAGIGLWYNTQASISRCKFIGNNNTLGNGGGLSSHSGNLIITDTEFSRNITRSEGGGLFIDHNAYADSSLSNVTFNDNQADAGGGIYSGARNLSIANAVFRGNRSLSPWYGGALAGAATQITLSYTSLASNFSDGVLAHCRSSGDLPVTSAGNNLSDGPAGDCNLTQATDVVNQR